MKELVAAVVDSERGKGASLSALLAEHADRLASRPSKEEHDRLRAEVWQPPFPIPPLPASHERHGTRCISFGLHQPRPKVEAWTCLNLDQ